MCKMLLRVGALQDQRDHLGHTAADVARFRGAARAGDALRAFNLQAAVAAANRRQAGAKTHLSTRELHVIKKQQAKARAAQQRRDGAL